MTDAERRALLDTLSGKANPPASGTGMTDTDWQAGLDILAGRTNAPGPGYVVPEEDPAYEAARQAWINQKREEYWQSVAPALEYNRERESFLQEYGMYPEEAERQTDDKVGLWKDQTVKTNDERDALIAELRRIQNSNSIPAVRRKNEIRKRLAELDAMLGNKNMDYTFSDTFADILSGYTKESTSGVANFGGTVAQALAALGRRLGGNTSDYAGWATDELSSELIGMQNDSRKWDQAEDEATRIQRVADSLGVDAQQEIDRAKAGKGRVAQAGIDIAGNWIQMGEDAAIGFLTGGGALVPMFIRAAGSAAQEARKEGASLGQQVAYGAGIGTIEMLTEKMFDGVAHIYGGGAADDFVKSQIRQVTQKLGGSQFGRTILNMLASAGGEGVEEIVSNILEPAAKTIYNGKSLGESYSENFSLTDMLYDGLIGFSVGLLGGAGNIVSGENRTMLQQMDYADQAQAALREQWGTDRAGRRAATEYAELIGRGLTGELSSRDQARLDTKPTAVSVMEDIRNRNPQAYNRAAQETGFVRDNLQAMFRSAGINATDAELDVLANGYVSGTNGVSNYLRDVSNSFNYGSMGLTLEQARKSAEKAGSTLNPVQFEHAFKLGEAKSADTADITTDEGRTKVRSYLSKLGNQAEAAAEVYEPTQDVQKYAEAMGKAVQLFAANGGDLKTIWNDAKTGKTMSSISYLTEKQIDAAQKLGAEFRTEQAESASRREAAFAEKRAKLDTLLKKGGNAAEYVDSTLATQRYISQLREDIRGTAEGLELARKSEPGIVNTAEYKAAVARLNGLRKDLQGATELQKRLKKGQEKAIGKKPGRKKGKVVYADKAGNASGIEYQAVDRSKLSKTQQATTRIAEAIADATGLEIRIISVPTTKTKGVGGEYIPGAGGVMYLNIDMTVDGKNMAAGSLFHELTHWTQEYAPAKYEELKRFVLQESQKNPEKFEDIFNARNRTSGYKTLRVDQVTDEMVANACMRIFEDPEAVKRLAVQHKGLWETIRDFIVKFVDDVKAAFAEMDFSSDFNLMGESQLMVDSLEQMRDRFIDAFSEATENYQAEQIVGKENTATEGGVLKMKKQTRGTRTNSGNADILSDGSASTSSVPNPELAVNSENEQQQVQKVQYSVFEEDPETLKWLDDQEKAGKVVHTYKSFLEIDGKLYPPMASMKRDETGKKKMVKAMEVGRWEKSVGDLSKVKVDQKLGYGHLEIFKDNGKPTNVAYNPYQHSSNLMLNDQFSEAYQRPNLVTYECIIPESELTSGYRAPYAKDAVGRLPWKSGTVAGKVAKQKGIKRDVFLSRWLKPIRKVPDAEVAQHYKELLDGTDIAVPSNVVPPSLLHALEDAGVKIEYDPRAPKTQFQMISEVEETDKLIAVHNKTMSGLRRMIQRGGVPFPSLAVKKAGSGHNHYGPVSIVFGKTSIDPAVNRTNRIYGGDAWTPVEPRTEYEVDSDKAWKIQEKIKGQVGEDLYNALRIGGSLQEEEIARALGNSEGDIFEALKGVGALKYAYLKSIGKEPSVPTKEKRLDGFGKYSNDALVAVFKEMGDARIKRADYSDQEFRQKVADIFNRISRDEMVKKQRAKGADKATIQKLLDFYDKRPLYSRGDINVGIVQDALRHFISDGRKLTQEKDGNQLSWELRDNKEVESDPGYRKYIEDLYKGIIKSSGIRNDKDVFTPSGNRRSFKQLHMPATLDNIAKVMGKQEEKGITSFAGSNLIGTGTKTYGSVEEARADRGRLYEGDYIDEEEFNKPKEELNERLQELVEAAAKITSRDYAWEQRDSTREILLEAVRDCKTKTAMDRKLRSEAQWINYDPSLTEELWQLAEDTRNMRVPYFEAKLRRVVGLREPLAYIVEDTAEETDADLLKQMRDMGLNVLTYKAGDTEDRKRVLNSVERAQFQLYDEQMEFIDVTRSDMHPAMRAKLNEQNRLEEDLVQYFAEMDPSSDNWMSEEEIRGNLDFNFYNADVTKGDAYDAGRIIDELLGYAKGENLYGRQRAYLLAERLLPHVDATVRQNYVGGGNSERVYDAEFASWYNERHPSIYYPGYQPGDLFEHKYDKGGKADNIQKERDYLHGLLESGNLMEPELSEARDLLDQLTNPQPGAVFYQQWSEAAEDERQINQITQEISELEDRADIGTDNAELRKINTRLVKLNADRDRLIAKERKLSRKTSIDDILKNLSAYRYSDLESIAEQYSDSAWDVEPGTTREQLESELREALETLAEDMTPLQRQAPAMGYYVRPAETRPVSYQQFDDTYNDTKEESTGRNLAYSRIQSENAILSSTVKELKKTVKSKDATIEKILKKLARAKKTDAEKLAKRMMREYSSKADLGEVTEAIKAVGDYYLQTPVEKLDEVRVKELAREAAALIAQGAEETIETDNGMLREIRGSLEGQKVYIKPEFLGELDSYGGLKDVKNSLFGKRVYLSAEAGEGRISVDQLYEQLHADFGDYYFPEAGSDNGPANEGEEIMIISDVLSAADSMTVNPFDAYMGEAVEAIANGIAFRVMNENVLRPLLPAEAEKAFDQLGAVTEENREIRKKLDAATTRGEIIKEELDRLQQESKLSKSELIELRDQVYDLTSALKKADRMYSVLQAESEQRIAQVREEGAARVTEVRAKEREQAAKQIQGLKDHYQELQKKARERREESAGTTKYRKQVQKKAAALYEMLMKNDDKKHVPEVLKKPVAEFLESIDFTSKRQLAGGEETNADKEFGARLRALERVLSGQQDYIDGNSDVQQDLGGYVDISQENLQYLRDVIQMIDTALRENRDFTINQMGAAELKQLSNFLSNLNAAIRGLNTFMANARFQSVREAADRDIESLKKLGKPGKYAGSAVDRFAAWENGTPYYIMKRFGEGAKSLFDGLAKGWEKMAFNAKEIIEFTESLYSDKEVNTWKNEIRDIELSDGSKIRMTTAQIMELSMLLNREQALKHIEKGGIRIGDITEKGRVIHDTTHYHLTMDDIVKITGMLDARQRKVAQALQSYMARKGSEWGNEVSMRRFGYEFYTEGEHYYPIKTDANDRPMADTDAQMNSMFRLLNLSASKSLNPKASNALVVGNIFDTFADHMADMAKLNGMGLPILDAIKWFNFKERINYDDGTYDTRTMQGAMEQAYGTQALKYFRTLMKDINGMTESGDRGVSLPGKLMSNYKIAAVGANLRVALLQPTSYVRALTVLKPQYLAGVVPSRAAYQEAMKYSGTAVWKSLGYYDTDISKSMRGQIQHDDTLRDKIANASMVLAEKGDQLTWSRLWTACKRQAKGENANLRGQALMDRTAELFREVVYSSQVMDSTLTRSEIMRGKTNWTKAMSAFMAEPTLSYNILLDAASEYMNDVRREGKAGAWKRNSGKIGKALTVYVCSAAFSAVVESIADAARDDDDEKYLDKWLEAFLGEDSLIQGNLAQDLTILGKLPYIKNFISTLQGYSSSDMSTAAFSNLVNAYQIWEETIKLNNGTLDKATKVTYYGRMTEWGKIYKTLQALSQLSGVAAANMTRDVTAIWNLTVGSFNPDMKVRTYDSNAMSESKTAAYEETVKPTGIKKGQYKNILAQADEDGNGSVKQAEMDAYLKEAVAGNALTQEQADAIWNAQGWKKSWAEYGKPASSGTKSSTTSTETKKTSSEPNGEISGWDDFKTVAPIYGNPKKEAAYNAKPASMSLKRYTEMLKAADTDNNGSLKQDELGYQLKAAVQGGEISFDEAAKVWASQGWSHDLNWWAAKHP